MKPLPKLKAHLGKAERYLSPEAIFALNRVLGEVLDEIGLTKSDKGTSAEAWFVPVLFEKRSRAWHLACVDDSVWGDSTNPTSQEFLREAAWFLVKVAGMPDLLAQAAAIGKHCSDHGRYEQSYRRIMERAAALSILFWPERYERANADGIACPAIPSILEPVYLVGKELAKQFKGRCHNYPSQCDEFRTYVQDITPKTERAQAKLFHNHCSECVLNLLGLPSPCANGAREFVQDMLLFYSGVRNHRCLMLPGVFFRTLEECDPKETLHRIDCMFDPNDQRIVKCVKYTFQNPCNPSEYEFNQLNVCSGDTLFPESKWREMRGIDVPIAAAFAFYLAEVSKRSAEKPSGQAITILPIHDVWLGSVGYGGIWGCLICTFGGETERSKFVSSNIEKLRDACEIVAAELFASAIVTAASQPIEPPYDLVEHFVRILIHVQDWERIMVFKNVDGKPKWLYCYRRRTAAEMDPDEFMQDEQWARCEHQCCGQGVPCFRAAGSNLAGTEYDSRILRWANMMTERGMWSREIIPELSDEEISNFRDVTLEFEYPKTAVVPQNQEGGVDNTHELFEWTVVQQQIEVLRTILPKVRARRSALRNASVSIMGRNMSHNIGSHVLARLAASRPDDKYVWDNKRLSATVSYLQERMDFIAEVSTTNVFYRLPVRFWHEAISPLITREGGDPKPGDGSEPLGIVMKHITGIDDLPARYPPLPEKDVCFSAPGGRMGVQALYVILENLIRNSAKHGGTVHAEAKVAQRVSDDGVLTISITVPKPTTGSSVMLHCENKVPSLPDPTGKQDKCIDYISNGARFENDWSAETALFSLLKKGGTKPLLTFLIGNSGKATITLKLPFANNLCLPDFELAASCKRRAVEIKLSVRESDEYPDYYEVIIWDEQGNACDDKKLDVEAFPAKLYEVINSNLKKPMINDSGEVDRNNWGIREMYLAAAYLRGISLEELEAHEPEPRIFEAIPVDDGKALQTCLKVRVPCNLGFRFYINKQLVLFKMVKSNGATEMAQPGMQIVCYSDQEDAKRKLANFIGPTGNGVHHSYAILPEFLKDKVTLQARLRLPPSTFYENEVSNFQRESSPDEKPLIKKYIERIKSVKKIDASLKLNLYLSSDAGFADSALPVIGHAALASKITDCTKPESPYFIFDHHSGFITADKLSLLKDAAKVGFYETFGSKGDPQLSMILDKNNKELYAALFELAAISRIIILDERIQAIADHASFRSIKLCDLLPLMRIFVPNVATCNLNDPQSDKVAGWLNSFTNEDNAFSLAYKYFDFLVIHQTVIDKLRDRDRGLDDKLLNIAQEHGCEDRVVVCTGRGRPNRELPDFARFVQVSQILKWTVSQPSKFHLTDLLMHARRPSAPKSLFVEQ